MSTSSGGDNDAIKLQARHFKNKEGAIFLNMFETISTNYCLNNSSSQRRQNQSNFNLSIPNRKENQKGRGGLDMS